jgi:ATP-dependent Clp protease protease subunit
MENHIFIYNEIGQHGNTSDDVQAQISNMPNADKIVVHLSSPGGEVFTGWTIGNLLKASNKHVTVIIEGLCASIATYIALQADEIQMAETARFMIHNPAIGIEGEEKDLKAAAGQLASIKSDLIKIYKSKTGIEDGKISEMMDRETWLTANEAKELGFIDSIVTHAKAVAKISHNNILKMEKAKEQPSKLDEVSNKLLSSIDNLINSITGKVKNEAEEVVNTSVELEDGSFIWIDSEDGEVEGKQAFKTDEEGNRTDEPAPEGTHALKDGRSITVGSDGTIESVQEAEAASDDDEDVEALKNEIADLKAQILNKDSEMEVKNSDEKILTDKVTELENGYKSMLTDVENMKTMVVGGEAVIPKGIIKPTNKSEASKAMVSGLGNWGKNLKIN